MSVIDDSGNKLSIKIWYDMDTMWNMEIRNYMLTESTLLYLDCLEEFQVEQIISAYMQLHERLLLASEPPNLNRS